MLEVDRKNFLADRAIPLCGLEVSKSFEQLTYVDNRFGPVNQILINCSSKEKKYAHYIAQASWAGARIIQGQWTSKAEKLYDLLIWTFSDNGGLADLVELKKNSGLSVEEWDDLMQYTIQVRSCNNILSNNCLNFPFRLSAI
jgi:dipeptidyl-peptidase-3